MYVGVKMKCPECGKDMLTGFVTSKGIRSRVLWSNQKATGFVSPSRMHKLGIEFLTTDSNENLPAYRCQSCRMIIIKYSKRPTSK